jgi:molybdenum cofactor biosynthesis enzyme MoaA
VKCILAYEEIDFSRPYASPCCHIMPDDPAMNIKNITNLNKLLDSEVYSFIREKMDQDKKDPICKVCWNEESRGIISDRVLENHIREKRNTVELRSLKIALDYTCNMMCRICTPMLSSKWGSSNLADTSLKNYEDYSIKYPKYDIKNIIENSDLSKLERIKILGGEPFYSKKLEWFLDYLQSNTNYNDLRIYIVTNGSVFPKPDILKKLLQSKSLHIEFSLDAVGEQTQLCRWGVDWKQIDTNIQKWIALKNKKIKTSAHCTLSIYNCNLMQPLVDYCQQNNIFLHVNKLRHPNHLSIDMIDNDTRKKWILEGKTTIEKTVNKVILNKESVINNSKDRFLYFNKILDDFQKVKLKDLNKEIYEYFYTKG